MVDFTQLDVFPQGVFHKEMWVFAWSEVHTFVAICVFSFFFFNINAFQVVTNFIGSVLRNTLTY